MEKSLQVHDKKRSQDSTEQEQKYLWQMKDDSFLSALYLTTLTDERARARQRRFLH